METKINVDEYALHAKWVVEGEKMLVDDTGKRIEYLIANVLEETAISNDGWEKLYQDPNDKRFWELTYTNSELHGGGPPSLVNISKGKARTKYNLI